MVGGIGEGKLETVSLSQQQADVLVPPVGSGQVLQEEQQLLGETERESETSQRKGRGMAGRDP